MGEHLYIHNCTKIHIYESYCKGVDMSTHLRIFYKVVDMFLPFYILKKTPFSNVFKYFKLNRSTNFLTISSPRFPTQPQYFLLLFYIFFFSSWCYSVFFFTHLHIYKQQHQNQLQNMFFHFMKQMKILWKMWVVVKFGIFIHSKSIKNF
jgi:hypothetical protein